MSRTTNQRRTRSGRVARNRAAAIVFAIGCALQLEARAMDHFWMESPKGSGAGGDVVTIHIVTTKEAQVEAVLFGSRAAKIIRSGQTHTVRAITPPVDREGAAIAPGVYERRVEVELEDRTKIDEGPSFFYIDQRPSDAATDPGVVSSLSLEPGHGRAEGGDHVTITSPALPASRDCRQLEVLFRSSPAKVVSPIDSRAAITVMVPAFETPNLFEEVPVELRCAGKKVAAGKFLYMSSPPPVATTTGPIAATAVVGVVLAAQLLWILQRLGKLTSRNDPPPTAASEATTDDSVDAEMLTRFAAEHRRAIDDLQRSLMGTVGSMPQQIATLLDAREKLARERGSGTHAPHDSSTQPPRPVPPSKGRAKAEQPKTATSENASSKGREEASTTFSAMRLAEMWNELRRARKSSEQLIESLNSAWPNKVVARASGSLIVVTSADEDSTWVLPSMQPLVHESTIQEFFDVRPPSEATGPRLVRPANVPRGTDPHGFTAGQITRGVLEA